MHQRTDIFCKASPFDLREEVAEFCAALRVDAFDESDAALEVRAEGRVRFAILRIWPEANAVGVNRLEALEVGTNDVGVFVDDDARQILANALAHHAGLAMMPRRSLLPRGSRQHGRQSVRRCVRISGRRRRRGHQRSGYMWLRRSARGQRGGYARRGSRERSRANPCAGQCVCRYAGRRRSGWSGTSRIRVQRSGLGFAQECQKESFAGYV